MNADNPVPDAAGKQPSPQDAEPARIISEKTTTIAAVSATVAVTGKRQALRDIRRQLEESELASSGVQKLLIEMLERAEYECEIAEGYRDQFHQADKRAAVLEEKLKTQKALEIVVAAMLTIGGASIGIAPSLWSAGFQGPITLAFGLVLIVGAVLARVAKR